MIAEGLFEEEFGIGTWRKLDADGELRRTYIRKASRALWNVWEAILRSEAREQVRGMGICYKHKSLQDLINPVRERKPS
jgi:hypothetical protein